MLKLVKSIKKLERFWRQIFNLLPMVSLGGTALLLGALALAPNFMNFAHAEEKPALKPSDIKLSISLDETFHKFNDVYLTADGVEHEDQDNVTFKPTVETNNPAGYKIYFSDVDEDTSMRSVDATVTDSIRSATPSDFENGVPKNTSDNYWYCGILGVPYMATEDVAKTNSTNNDLSIPARSRQKLIDEVKYVNIRDDKNNGVICKISINKQLTPSTYVGKMIFTTVANTNNLKSATLKDGYATFSRIPYDSNGKREYRSFKYAKPTPRYLSNEIRNDESIFSNIKTDYMLSSSIVRPGCPNYWGFDTYNLTANNTDDEEPVLIWAYSPYCDEYNDLYWWTPSGTLKLGEDCSNFFSTANAPRFDKIDLSGIDISKCKNMESMFERTDDGFKEINFGSNTFSSDLKNTKKMFKNNPDLEKIIVKSDTDLRYVHESSEMFDGDTNLVGSYNDDGGCELTRYNPLKTDGSMAKTFLGYFYHSNSDECITIKPGRPTEP